MQELNQSFILYTNYSEILTMLSDEDLGKIFRAILIYKKNKEVIELPNQLAVIFALVKNQLDLDELKYNEKCQKNSDKGKKGGAPIGNLNAKKTTENNPKQPKTTQAENKTTQNNPKQPKPKIKQPKTTQNNHNDNDNDNENDNENDYSFKKENKEKSFQNFQNSDFEENGTNETNEINEINEPSLRAIAKQSKDSNALLEEEKGEDFEKNSKMEEVCKVPPAKKNKENDPYSFYSKIRAEYENIIGKQGAYLNDTQVHELYRLYLSTDDFMETLNDTLKELVKVQKIFKKKIGYSPGLDWIVKADGKNYTTLRNKSFTGLEEENKENEVFQIEI